MAQRVWLYLIRHGTAEHNVQYEKFGEAAYVQEEMVDTSLVPKGAAEAQELGCAWSRAPVVGDWLGPHAVAICDAPGSGQRWRAVPQEATGGGSGPPPGVCLDSIDLVLVSPLRRTLQTCEGVFGKDLWDRTATAVHWIKEHPQGSHKPNRMGSSVNALRQKYPAVDFSLLPEGDAPDRVWDTMWNADRWETDEEVSFRVSQFLQLLHARVHDLEFVRALQAQREARARARSNSPVAQGNIGGALHIAVVSHTSFLKHFMAASGYGWGASSKQLKHCSPYVMELELPPPHAMAMELHQPRRLAPSVVTGAGKL